MRSLDETQRAAGWNNPRVPTVKKWPQRDETAPAKSR